MPLQNRVLPTGEIVADAARGMFTGNRGCLHDDQRQLGRARWKGKAWITCALSYKGIRRQLMTPHRWTELFFLDEAVALAAGHRPCAECRRGAFRAYQAAWGLAGGLGGAPGGGKEGGFSSGLGGGLAGGLAGSLAGGLAGSLAGSLAGGLAAGLVGGLTEAPGGRQDGGLATALPRAPAMDAALHVARLDGRVQRRFSADLASLPQGVFVQLPGGAHLLWQGALHPFAPGGYGAAVPWPGGRVQVMTPAPSVAVLRAGYVPQVALG